MSETLPFRLRQPPTMRPWGTWPAGDSGTSTMREGWKSIKSIEILQPIPTNLNCYPKLRINFLQFSCILYFKNWLNLTFYPKLRIDFFQSCFPLRYVDGAADRERLEQEKKEAKLEKLRKVAEVKFFSKEFPHHRCISFSTYRVSSTTATSTRSVTLSMIRPEVKWRKRYISRTEI